MKKYVVSFIDFFDNQLISTIIEANSEIDSMLEYLKEHQNINLKSEDFEDEEAVKSYCFNMDSMINSIEI